MGKTKLIAETGAGQHGVATALVNAMLDMEVEIFMGAKDVARQRKRTTHGAFRCQGTTYFRGVGQPQRRNQRHDALLDRKCVTAFMFLGQLPALTYDRSRLPANRGTKRA